jgi:hypothetical protein
MRSRPCHRVLAFGTDPVARWMYDDPHQYLMHIPRLFRALGTNSFEAGAAQRTSDGLGVALWLPPGVHGDSGRLDAVLLKALLVRSKPRSASSSKGPSITGRPSLIGTCRSSASKLWIGTKDVAPPYCSTVFANATASTARRTSGRRTRKILRFTRGTASRSWIRSKSVRRLPSFRCCARRAEDRTDDRA